MVDGLGQEQASGRYGREKMAGKEMRGEAETGWWEQWSILYSTGRCGKRESTEELHKDVDWIKGLPMRKEWIAVFSL